MNIDFYFTHDCPHAEAAWTRLQEVLADLGITDARVRRVAFGSFREALDHGIFGSPSIQIDGRDIEGPVGTVSLSCRSYEGGTGVPARWLLEAALLRALNPRGVLFLCVANSARSQMAEGIARLLAPPDVRIFSAGSEPTSPRPEAMRVLQSMGVDVSGHFSKHVDSIDPSLVDTVITLCAEEACPLFLGKARRIHWGLDDPAAVQGDEAARLNAFFRTAAELQKRLEVIWKPDADQVRQRVSESYARALGSCTSCGPASSCCTGAASSCCVPSGGDLSETDAGIPSWGCGDPVDAAGIAPGETILDVGCGAGRDLLAAARKTGPAGRVVGLDMTGAMLEAARRNLADAGIGNFELVQGTLERMPLPDALADCVISNCVVNLSPEKERVFAEIFRVLQPGGRLVFADICADELPPWAKNSLQAVSACIGGAESVDGLLDAMRRAGFENPRVLDLKAYSTVQIREMLGQAFDAGEECDCCSASFLPSAFRDRLASMLAGHLFSVLFFARRPRPS